MLPSSNRRETHMSERKIELLAPAGDMERLEMAVAYGADAPSIWRGPPSGCAPSPGKLHPGELKRAVALCRQKGRAGPRHLQHHAPQRRGGRLPEWLTYLDRWGWTPSSWPTWA